MLHSSSLAFKMELPIDMVYHLSFHQETSMNLSAFKVTFDGILEQYVGQKIHQAKTLLDNQKLNTYIDYINTFIFSGGKRIRPYCLWIAYR